MRGIGVIAGLTWREALRRRILTAALVLGLAFLALYGLGLHLSLSDTPMEVPRNAVIRRQVLNVLLILGLYAVNWLTVVVTILVSVDTLAGEIASGTIQAVASKPLRRWELVMGKYAGFAAMLTLYLLLMGGGVVLEVAFFSGRLPPNLLRVGMLMWLEGLLLLAVSFRAGASLSTLATGVLVFGLHVLAFLGGWIEEIGSVAQSQTAVNIGVIASLIMPSESLWRRAASEVQGPVLGGIGRTPFTITSVPSGWMVLYAVLYLSAALWLAVRRFSRRDL
ncbi:MAG: ABC transporter permease [Rhodospirillales bacterium]